jgi:hypothetical protein
MIGLRIWPPRALVCRRHRSQQALYIVIGPIVGLEVLFTDIGVLFPDDPSWGGDTHHLPALGQQRLETLLGVRSRNALAEGGGQHAGERLRILDRHCTD